MTGSLLEIEPARRGRPRCAEGAGNPIARGSARRGRTRRRHHGAPGGDPWPRDRGGAALRAADRDLGDARLDLLERPLTRAEAVPHVLHGYEIATLQTQLNLPRVIARRPRGARAGSRSGTTALRPVLAAQPRTRAAGRAARRRPPAPAPGWPRRPGEPVELRLTAASDCSDASLHGTVRLRLPAGVDVRSRRAAVPAARRATTWRPRSALTMPPATPPGRYPVRAELARHRQRPDPGRRGARSSRTCASSSSVRPPTTMLRLVAEPQPVEVDRGGDRAPSPSPSAPMRAPTCRWRHT